MIRTLILGYIQCLDEVVKKLAGDPQSLPEFPSVALSLPASPMGLAGEEEGWEGVGASERLVALNSARTQGDSKTNASERRIRTYYGWSNTDGVASTRVVWQTSAEGHLSADDGTLLDVLAVKERSFSNAVEVAGVVLRINETLMASRQFG